MKYQNKREPLVEMIKSVAHRLKKTDRNVLADRLLSICHELLKKSPRRVSDAPDGKVKTIGDVAKKYGVTFDESDDMELDDFLNKKGYPSLAIMMQNPFKLVTRRVPNKPKAYDGESDELKVPFYGVKSKLYKRYIAVFQTYSEARVFALKQQQVWTNATMQIFEHLGAGEDELIEEFPPLKKSIKK